MSLKKISEMTGVSLSTVSRVLNDPEHKCQDEAVRRKILQAARELEYIPNEAARSLKKGLRVEKQLYRVNVLVTRGEYDPFYSQILRILEINAIKQDILISDIWYNTLLSDLEKERTAELSKVLDEMSSKNDRASEGLIILGKCSSSALEQIKKRWKNVVALNRNSIQFSIDEVICDGGRLAATAVEYLIRLGHRRIAYVGDTVGESRFAGYQNTLFGHNINLELKYIYSEGIGFDRGRYAMEHFARLPEPPTAVYCSSDVTALGMLNSLGKSKTKYYCPSVISSDNIDEAQYSRPMLTTVEVPKELMAKYALGLLKDRMKGGHKEKIKIEFEGQLIVRESCSDVREFAQIEYYI